MKEKVFKSMESSMEKSIAAFQKELNRLRTGRASPALLEGIRVDYYGTPTPIDQTASINIPESRLIVIQPWDKSTIESIEKAIQKANLGLSPTNDGKVIRINIPPLTEERRKDMVKQVKKLAEDHKVGVRDSRRAALGMLKDLVKEGLPQDDGKRAEKSVQDLTDEFVQKIDDMAAAKEKEVLEV